MARDISPLRNIVRVQRNLFRSKDVCTETFDRICAMETLEAENEGREGGDVANENRNLKGGIAGFLFQSYESSRWKVSLRGLLWWMKVSEYGTSSKRSMDFVPSDVKHPVLCLVPAGARSAHATHLCPNAKAMVGRVNASVTSPRRTCSCLYRTSNCGLSEALSEALSV
jgi:hypothetical protein